MSDSFRPDPITDAEVAGVPHCGGCGQPLMEGRLPHVCPDPPVPGHDFTTNDDPQDAADEDDESEEDVDPADPDAIFDGLDAGEDDLPEAVASEVDEDGTAAETGAVLDDDEDPGVPQDDDPFGPEYTGQA